MTWDTYDLWRYVHVLLFVYWLGADLGVFYAAKFVVRSDLSVAERRRFLELTLLIDMGPRTGLILILPVGFQLSVMSGLIELYAWALGLIWLFSLIWLAVMWAGHLQHHSGSRGHLRRIDMWFRYTAIISMAALGTLSLTTNEPFLASWLSLKAVLFATVVAIGMYLRTIISAWGLGFEKLMRDDECEEGNCLIASAGRKGTLGALLLWALLFAISFLGVIKPL